MKKLLSIFAILVTILATQCIFVSCEKEDDDYYAGESEADYRPAEYTFSATWDLSRVSGLSEVDKSIYKSNLEDACKAVKVFNSRAEAVEAFDMLIESFRTNPDVAIPGAKAKFYLKRDGATIKSATLSW